MITIDLNKEGILFRPHWSTCVGAGRANELLRAESQRQLKMVQEEIGFRYLRFHGLLHDDMFVVREEEDCRIYNFQYVDELMDTLLDMGIRPFVELGFFPECLKGGEATQFWWKGNITPPDNWSGWCDLVDHLLRHWIGRYGIEEVRKWYFEVWNEPNLSVFWDGTRSQYFEMYAETVKTIQAIDEKLRVGGPATSNFVPDERFAGEKEDLSIQKTHLAGDLDALEWKGVWIEAFLSFCAERGLPVDFVSTHPYPTDFAVDSSGRTTGRSRHREALREDLSWLQQVVRNSAYPEAEIHLTEWSSSPTPRDCSHDYLQEAAFIVYENLSCIGMTDSLSYWTFTDIFEENGAGDSIFHGGFGLVNFQGIRKPGYHAYRMLAKLGEEFLYQDEHLFVTRRQGKLAAILVNYPIDSSVGMSIYPDRSLAESELDTGEAVPASVLFTGLKPGTQIQTEVLDRHHGWAFPLWQAMGSPEPPTREQTNELRKAAACGQRRSIAADAEGRFLFETELTPWTVILIEETDLEESQPGNGDTLRA